jgi:eukaryotic-like serine/threonine-protein kinase
MPQQTPLRTGDPGRVGRYRLAGRIAGIPADGPIYLGISPDGVEVAISMLRTDWAQNAAARDRFAAEAAVAKRVPPFCAARVLDAGLEGCEAYLVSEYVPGPSLLDVVAADGVRVGPDLEAVAIGMATGLASVHQAGLVHGNFGPEYMIMASDGAPRVVEFGITPPNGIATPAADMMAWGRTVVFAAIGQLPTSRSDLEALPGRLSAVTAQCLAPDPAERPPARSVVRSLLGNVELPAGVLAEGMRRAEISPSYATGEYRPAGRPGHSAGSPGPARRPHHRRSRRDRPGSLQADQPRPVRDPPGS